MPPRLAHKKSRAGCSRCKARRVKCDETHPVCNNCHRHGVSCQYPAQARQSNDIHKTESEGSPSINHNHLEDPQDVRIEDIADAEQRRLLELQLMHHFITVVTYTFPSSNIRLAREMWTNYAISLSFKHNFLLNAMLAVAALHLLSSASTSSRFFAGDEDLDAVARVIKAPRSLVGTVNPTMIHHVYLNLAVKQQQDAVARLNPEEADALFLSTILFSYQAIVRLPGDSQAQVYSPPTHWLRMVQAITSTAAMVVPAINGESLVEFLAREGGEPNFRDEAEIFNPENRKHFEALLDWAAFPEPSYDGNVKATYEKVLSYVGGIYRGLLVGEAPRVLFRRILCLGVQSPTQFISLVQERRPRALAILAYHCAMAYSINDHWVFHGMAEREVYGLQTLLPSEWQWAMEWPMAMIQRLKDSNLSIANESLQV